MRSFLLSRGFILPLVVVGVIPISLALVTRAWERLSPAFVILGSACFCVGLELLRRTTSLFHRSHGSLAPWNPPTQMVIEGPYRYTRNPMITGILTMLLGEALALRSRAIAGWLCLFAIAQNVYIQLDEEPRLRERFGASYEEYERTVPRWIPGWTGHRTSSRGGS